MGFQAELGTETAIDQTAQAMEGRQKRTEVLDLKSAYDTVRRDQLFERCAKVLPDHITATISHTLQTLTVTTVGDDTKTEAKIDRGVTQGGPASPTIFIFFSTPSPMHYRNINGIQISGCLRISMQTMSFYM